MSNVFAITAEANQARLLAFRDLVDSAAQKGYIEFYSAARPGSITGTYTPAARATLARPCGTMVTGYLKLVPDAAGGEMVTTTATILWGRIFKGDGTPVADGDVTDESGDGAFKLAGTAGTTLFAGGYLLLATAGIG